MNRFWDFVSTSGNWSGPDGIASRLAEHAGITVAVLAIAAAVALPIGAVVGHSRRGDDVPVALGALGRLLPPLAVFTYLAVKTETGNAPVITALVVLALPPMMSAAYAGVRLVDRATVESARAAGMIPTRVLREVELPIAAPDLIAGVRRSAVLVVSMLAVAAYVGADGLGRLIIDGQAPGRRDYGEVATGGVMVAAVAVVLDLLIVAIGAALVSPGLAGRPRRTRPPVAPRPHEETAAQLDGGVLLPPPPLPETEPSRPG